MRTKLTKIALIAGLGLAVVIAVSCSEAGIPDAQGCTVEPKAEGGYDVLCAGKKVGELKNGVNGEKGEQGEKGEPGESGAAGPAGGQKGDKGDRGDPGSTGKEGPSGPSGPRGEKGEKGDSGPQGQAGPQGPQGPAGKDGTSITAKGTTSTMPPSGKQGDFWVYEGETNATYTKGNGYIYDGSKWVSIGQIQGNGTGSGPTGPQGPAGPQGPKGDTGADGVKGDKGDKGDTGATGLQGPQGPKGDTGAKGDKGDKGDPGAAGKDGNNGKDGTNGKDGIGITAKGFTPSLLTSGNNQGDFWVYTGTSGKYEQGHGYIWDTDHWVDIGQIQGKDGKDGTGITLKGTVSNPEALHSKDRNVGDLYTVTGNGTISGDTHLFEGQSYSTGDGYVWNGTHWQNVGPIQGQQGPQGPKGEQGLQGEKGNTGAKGDKGDKGETGAIGLQGPQGPKGEQGLKGDTGPQGEKGDTGPKGDKGDKGDSGAKGDKGADGVGCELIPISGGSGVNIKCGNQEYPLLNGAGSGGCNIKNPDDSKYYIIDCGGTAQEYWGKAWCNGEVYNPNASYCEGDVIKDRKLNTDFPLGTSFTPQTLGLNPGRYTSELNFNWYSGTSSASSSIVRVFKNGYHIKDFSGTSNSASSSYLQHKVTITGLEPGAKYTYRVSNNGTNWSADEYEFKVPTPGPFKFAAISDVQPSCSSTATNKCIDATLNPWKSIATKLCNAGATLIVNSGDHTENGRENEFDGYFSPPELRSIPTAPVMGNHDMQTTTNFNYHFNLPNIQVNPTAKYKGERTNNYYFLYNRVLFINLNTSPYVWDPAGGYIGRPTGQTAEQDIEAAKKYVADFRSTIDAAKNAHSPLQYDFIVVTHHKSTNSVTNCTNDDCSGPSTNRNGHTLDDDIIAYIGAGFQKLMTEKGVDLVLTGHNHIYVRSQLMYNDHPSSGENANKGTLYLTLKPAGMTRNYAGDYIGYYDTNIFRDVYPYIIKDSGITRNDKKLYLPESYANHSLYNGTDPGYSIIEVNGKNMKINIYEHDGRLFEYIELTPTLPKL